MQISEGPTTLCSGPISKGTMYAISNISSMKASTIWTFGSHLRRIALGQPITSVRSDACKVR